jgi:hypothetical protein
MNTNWARRISQFESAQVRYADDPLPGQAAFRYRPGTRPVLISAPHGAYHWRQNYWKRPDGYTAALAYVLAEYTGAHALYTVRRIRPDPNFEDDSDYKRTLALLLQQRHIRLVLDLHGASPDRDFALALGTIDGRSCPDYEAIIIQTFREQAFEPDHSQVLDRLALNPLLFKGGARQHTVTRFVWEQCRVNAIQVELNAHLRVVYANAIEPATFTPDPIRQRRAINALINIITAI